MRQGLMNRFQICLAAKSEQQYRIRRQKTGICQMVTGGTVIPERIFDGGNNLPAETSGYVLLTGTRPSSDSRVKNTNLTANHKGKFCFKITADIFVKPNLKK